MKRLFLFLFFTSITVQSQDYADVDAKVKRYPKFNSAQKITQRYY